MSQNEQHIEHTAHMIVAPLLRKSQSSPSMTGFPDSELPPFPIELQQQLAARKGESKPERWMCVVVRRQKMTCAVGRLVHVDKMPT